MISHQVKDKQNHLIEIRTVVANVDRQGLTGKRSDRVFWCDGNVFILIEPWVTQTYAFVKTYQTVHLISVHLRKCKLYGGKKIVSDYNLKI